MLGLSKAIIFLLTTIPLRFAAADAVVEAGGVYIDHERIQLPDKNHEKTNLTCFSDSHLLGTHCYGVNHFRFDDSIKKFCSIVDGFTVSNRNPKKALFMEFYYPANVDNPGDCNNREYAKSHEKCDWVETIVELGQIHLQVHRDDKAGSGDPLKVTKDSCTQSFTAIVDMCDTHGLDHKKGGQLMPFGNWGNDDLIYTLNPNPYFYDQLCHNVPDLGPDGNNGTSLLQIPSQCGDRCRVKAEAGQEATIEGLPSS